MPFEDFIRAQGVGASISVQAFEIGVSGVTGTFQLRETVTGGTSSATGQFVFYDATNNVMYLTNVTGTFQSAETLTGGTSSATATTSDAGTASTWSAYQSIGNLQNQLTDADSRQTNTVTTFASDPASFYNQISAGRTGQVNGQLALVPTDDGFAATRGAYEFNLPVRIKITRSSIGGAAYPDEDYAGTVSDFPRTYNEQGVAQATFTVVKNDVGPFA